MFDAPTEGFNPGRFARTIAGRGLFDVYARRFTRQGDTRIPQPTSGPRHEVAANYQVTDDMLNEFKQLVQQTPLRFDEAGWQKDRPYIAAMIQKEIDLDLFGAAKVYRAAGEAGPAAAVLDELLRRSGEPAEQRQELDGDARGAQLVGGGWSVVGGREHGISSLTTNH